MTDPFEQLHLPAEARTPPRDFTRALRQRLEQALGSGPPDPSEGLSRPTTSTRRDPTMTDATTTTTTTAATPVGATGLQAYLTVHDGPAAIEFYRRAFGAVEEFRVVGEDGRLGHAELTIGPARLMLSDEYPELDVRSPIALGGTGVTLYLVVADCDVAHASAVRSGARTVRPPEDQAHGNRTATLIDPFGHRWMLSQPLAAADLQDVADLGVGGFEVRPAAGRRGPGDGDATAATVWPCVNCVDARATIDLLVGTFGFEERLVVADDADPSVIHHAELRWPPGGGVMLGTADRQGSDYSSMPTGAASCYVVSPDVDQLWRRALAAGLEVVSELKDEDYGNRDFAVRDREGNIWSFGTYAGE